jgi:beta-galactosidase
MLFLGTDVDTAFLAQRIYEPHGPLVNSELYVGWLTHWGETFQKVGTDAVVNTLDKMLARNASVNLYMFFGGTNFGFLAGEIPRTGVGFVGSYSQF